MTHHHRALRLTLTLAAITVALAGSRAEAHWCNNIWAAPSRIVVKPEVTSLSVGAGGAKLRVYVRNNLPYRLFSVQMQGSASGYQVAVSPASQDIYPGQNVSFVFSLTGSGTVTVSNLNLQLQFRPGNWPSGWLSDSHCLLDQGVSKSTITEHTNQWWSHSSACKVGNQASSLNAGTLHDMDPAAKLTASAPWFGRTGAQQLIKWFGYRFCWTSGGTWRGGGQDCPSPTAEGSAWSSVAQFPQNCMRAGVELAVRKAKLGSNLTAARGAAVNALKGGCSLGSKPTQHKCLAAVVGAYLWQGAASTAAFTSALKDSSNCVPAACQSAGLGILTGAPAGSCSGLSAYEERAACAAAEGLRNNDGPVKTILMALGGDGYQPNGGNYSSLYYAYMLHVVTAARKAQAGKVSFYPDAGSPFAGKKDQGKPLPDKSTDDNGAADKAGSTDIKTTADKKATADSTPTVTPEEGCAVAGHGHGGHGILLLTLALLALARRRGVA